MASPPWSLPGSRMSNGVERARVVRRKDVSFRKTSGNIAAIDFGTKNCSLAYVLGGKLGGDAVNKLSLNGTNKRVPTAILLNKDREVVQFGQDARTRYADLDADERDNMYYFDSIKVNLQQDKNVHHGLTIRALNLTEFLLVDVISYILGYLKTELLETLRKGGHVFSAAEFDWVVTVPAIWRASGKQMMRKAAYQAGMGSEESPDQLSLVLEPEAGAIYCHEMLKQGRVAYPSLDPNSVTPPPPTYSYLIVDIGGGTVDISAHRVTSRSTLSVEELHYPVGNHWGGRQVNTQFSIFLQELIDDRDFTRYRCVDDMDERVIRRFDLDELLNDEFEKKKQIFGRTRTGDSHPWSVKLPDDFVRLYREILTASLAKLAKNLRAKGRGEEIVTLRNNSLYLPLTKMEVFMKPVITGIIGCVRELTSELSSCGVKIDIIYLVGGFGSCHYIYKLFQQLYGDQCRIVVPPNPEYAIVEGAVYLRCNPAFVRARKADATYGKSVVRDFEESFHDPQFREGSHCKHLFQTIVSVGEDIHPNYVYVATSRPLDPDQQKMHFEVYSSKKPAHELLYTKTNEVVFIGQLELALPETGKRARESREVDIIFDFSHTEIQVKAYDKISRAEVKAVLDFLSASSVPQPQQSVTPPQGGEEGEKEGEGEGEEEGGMSAGNEHVDRARTSE